MLVLFIVISIIYNLILFFFPEYSFLIHRKSGPHILPNFNGESFNASFNGTFYYVKDILKRYHKTLKRTPYGYAEMNIVVESKSFNYTLKPIFSFFLLNNKVEMNLIKNTEISLCYKKYYREKNISFDISSTGKLKILESVTISSGNGNINSDNSKQIYFTSDGSRIILYGYHIKKSSFQ